MKKRPVAAALLAAPGLFGVEAESIAQLALRHCSRVIHPTAGKLTSDPRGGGPTCPSPILPGQRETTIEDRRRLPMIRRVSPGPSLASRSGPFALPRGNNDFEIAPLELAERVQSDDPGIRRDVDIPVQAVVGHDHPVFLEPERDRERVLRKAAEVHRGLETE